MARILLTGGAGFLGINLARHLLDRDHEVVSLDIADFAYPERDRVSEFTGDIRDRAAVDKARWKASILWCTLLLPCRFIQLTKSTAPMYRARGM